MRAIIIAILVVTASAASADTERARREAARAGRAETTNVAKSRRTASTRVTAKAPPPVEPQPPPSVTLPQGKVRVDTTVETEMTTDKVAKPVSIAPDLAFGATNDLMIDIATSKFATTGFRGSAGGGFCARSANNGCAHVFNAGGVEAWYALSKGVFATAFGGGPFAMDVDAGYYDFKVGFKTKLTAGRFVSTLSPVVFFAATKRTDYQGMAVNKDTLYAPVTAGVKITRDVTVAVGSGIKGPLEDFKHHWSVPLGLSTTLSITRDFGVGASFVFGTLVSAAANPPPPMPPIEGMDLRVIQVWATYTR